MINNLLKYVFELCECNNFMFLLEDVKCFLQNWKILVVDWCFVQDKLRVKDFFSMLFVVIFYVWGDGLCGMIEKGFFEC